MRYLILIHRYLGIALGILMAAWCLSGVVMMYVGYPELTPADRLRALRPLDLGGCCTSFGDTLPNDAPVASFQLEMLAGRAVMRLRLADESSLIDLRSGKRLESVSPREAQAVATDFIFAGGGSGAAKLQQTLDDDQWTVAGVAPHERPLYRFAGNDRRDTEAYVSRSSGRLVQATTARQRFWNWLGAVPHWLYFAELRRNVPLWTRVVVWTSLAGCFLTATGLYLGVQRFLRRPAGRWSPYRGLLLWHHVPGFVAGVLALTWVASGLISMNPWGFLDSPDDDSRAADSGMLTGSQVKGALSALGRLQLPAGCVSIVSSFFNGQLYLIAATASGRRIRLDAQGAQRPLSAGEVDRWLRTMTGTDAAPRLLSDEDAYYFSHHRDVVELPVYRAVLADAQHTRYYIDPVSGAVIRRVDGNSRWYRWLHQGLHRMDFTPGLRTRPLWDAVMLVLMAAVTTICCTGAVLGIRRLRPRPD